jgi:hypothetical protein
MPDESAYYIINATDVSACHFMKNIIDPIAFPAGISDFTAGHLYSFTYDGINLTLLSDRVLSIDSALADVFSFPAGITATEIIIENYYPDTGLTPDTTYYYKVASVGANGRESRKSDPVNGTTLTQTIGNISYSPVTGSSWTSQSDGSHKSPSGYSSSKVRVNFTSYGGNATIAIQLYVYNSSTSSYSYAYVGDLDNSSASYYYYDYISAYFYSPSNSKTVTITVPYAGDHFIEIGYYNDGYGSSSTMYSTFKIVEDE